MDLCKYTDLFRIIIAMGLGIRDLGFEGTGKNRVHDNGRLVRDMGYGLSANE